MTVLAVITQLSDTLEQVIIEQSLASANDLLILTPNEQVKAELERIGFDVTLLSYHVNRSWEERDRLFKKVAMPGEILNINFSDTDLEVWEILSLDRLSFFFIGQEAIKQLETLELLQFDKVIISLDIHSHLTSMIGLLAKSRNVKSVACQVDRYFQSEEVRALAQSGYLDVFSEIVPGKREDSEWLKKVLNESTTTKPDHPFIIRDLGGEYPAVKPDAEKKKAYRKGFGFSETDTVLFLVFDLPHEHEFSKYLLTVNPEDRLLIWPVDDQSRKKLWVLAGGLINQTNGLVVEELSYHYTADRAVYFRPGSFLQDLSIPSELVS